MKPEANTKVVLFQSFNSMQSSLARYKDEEKVVMVSLLDSRPKEDTYELIPRVVKSHTNHLTFFLIVIVIFFYF